MFLECHKDLNLHSKYNSGGADWGANWAVPCDQDNEECREVESGEKKEEERKRRVSVFLVTFFSVRPHYLNA